MKRALGRWFAAALAMIGVAFIVSIFQSSNYIGGPILAAVFGAAAWRAWHLAGNSTKPPTGVGG